MSHNSEAGCTGQWRAGPELRVGVGASRRGHCSSVRGQRARVCRAWRREASPTLTPPSACQVACVAAGGGRARPWFGSLNANRKAHGGWAGGRRRVERRIAAMLWSRVLLSADGGRLGWSGEGSGPRVWEWSLQARVARACQLAHRELSQDVGAVPAGRGLCRDLFAWSARALTQHRSLPACAALQRLGAAPHWERPRYGEPLVP